MMEMDQDDQTRRLRRFGFTVGTAFGVAAAFFAWQQVPRASAALAALGGYLLFWGGIRPAMLRSLEWAWRGAGRALGWINTRAALVLIFFLMVAPLGILSRLLGRDPLGRRLVPEKASYFEARRERRFPPESFRRPY